MTERRVAERRGPRTGHSEIFRRSGADRRQSQNLSGAGGRPERIKDSATVPADPHCVKFLDGAADPEALRLARRWDNELANYDEERVTVARAYLEALERIRTLEADVCRHGWRGSVPENGKRIATPCPACGAQSLFVGGGGHLTCSRVPSDFGTGCDSPSVKRTVEVLKERAQKAEADLAAARKLLESCRGVMECEGFDEEVAQIDAILAAAPRGVMDYPQPEMIASACRE